MLDVSDIIFVRVVVIVNYYNIGRLDIRLLVLSQPGLGARPLTSGRGVIYRAYRQSLTNLLCKMLLIDGDW